MTLTPYQLIERIWLLFLGERDSERIGSSLHEWWHTPFKNDEPVLKRDELLDILSNVCGTELFKKLRDSAPEEKPAICGKFGLKEDDNRDSCIKKCCEIISAVLKERDDPVLGFSWKFADDNKQYDDTAKKRFKKLIFLCNEWLKTSDS